MLGAPTLTFGQIADIRGLDGDTRVKRLSILSQPGDVGGPVFDESGAVVGMLLPRMDTDGQVLPADVQFSLDAAEIVQALQGKGVTPTTRDPGAPISPVALTKQAADTTVLVSCW